MANKPLKKKEAIAETKRLRCLACSQDININNFYDSDSEFYRAFIKLPYCKDCINKLYTHYYEKFKALEYKSPDRKAVERLCMAFDLFYSDEIFNAAKKEYDSKSNVWETTIIAMYMKHVKKYQYRDKDYDYTVYKKYSEEKNKESTVSFYDDEEEYIIDTVKSAMKIFGSGFEDEEYVYLYEQYGDWTSRHECNTKAQEEVFKNICMTQLQLKKATQAREDTDKLATQLQKWLDTGKLQPKQNSGDVISDAQTFGTLIDKWENTRPIPETDPELEDIDYFGKYIDVFFKGGLADSLGLNTEHSQAYIEWMDELTVEKPEYDDNSEGNGVSKEIHEAIFGASLEDDDGGE